jgi:hypothetical protein
MLSNLCEMPVLSPLQRLDYLTKQELVHRSFCCNHYLEFMISRFATIELCCTSPLLSGVPLTTCLSGLRPAEPAKEVDLGRKGTGVVGRDERNCAKLLAIVKTITPSVQRANNTMKKNSQKKQPKAKHATKPEQHPHGSPRPKPSAASRKPCTRCK